VARDLELAWWRPEREEVTGASNSWRSQWQAHRRWMGGLRWLTATWLKHQSTWRKVANSGEFIRIDRELGGHGGRSEQWLKFIHTVIFTTRATISTSLSTNRSIRRESERVVAGGEMSWSCDLILTLYHRNPDSECLTDRIAMPRSRIFVQELANPFVANL
jgi:hypothetical protein